MAIPAQYTPLNSYSLALVPYISPSNKKLVGSEPTANVAREVLINNFLQLSELPNVPLNKSRVKSNKRDESDLVRDINKDFYVNPFNEYDECISESEEDLSIEDKESIEEEFRDEENELKAKIDAFFDEEDIKFQSLQKEYKKWKKTFKTYASYAHKLLAVLEYLTDNKDNIVLFIKRYSPNKAIAVEFLFDVIDNVFKWGDCGIPFLASVIKLFSIKDFDKQAQKIKDAARQFFIDHQNQQDFTTASTDRILKKHSSVNQFQSKLEQDKDEAKNKICLKGAHLISQFSGVALTILDILRLKTASKVTKSTYKIFKISMASLNCYNMNHNHKEWMFHLQPYFLVNIEPENPTSDEEENFEAKLDAQEELIENVKDFLISLEGSSSLEEVKKILKDLNLSFALPATIDQFKQMFRNPRFVRDLVQCYYYLVGRRAAISASKLFAAIKKKEEEHNRKINHCLPFIIDHVAECQKQNLSFAEIRAHFAKLHIDINSITIPNDDDLPPTDEVKWRECVQNDEFIKALAGRWVDFQEATAQMVMQTLRQALESKLEVERKFLLFQAVEIGVGFISTIAQLCLCNPQIKLIAISSALEILFTDIAKLGEGYPGLGVFHLGSPLYPGVKFKIESLFLLIAKHFFAIPYKPNEYSLKGYFLSMQLQWAKLLSLFYSLLFMLQTGVLWINIRLVDNCIKSLEVKSLEQDPRYIDLWEQYDHRIADCTQAEKNAENDLWKLKVEDVNLIFNSHSQKTRANYEPSNPIKDIVDSMREADIDYFPPLVIEFFENHLGFTKLSNANKEELEKHLKMFFSQSEENFLSSYGANRFDYLKI